MKLLMVVGLSVLLAGCAIAPARGLRVLFVGNQLSYANDLPAMVRALSLNQAGLAISQTELLAERDARLVDRITDGSLERVLAERRFDIVVLQDLRSYPLCSIKDPECLRAATTLRESVAIVRRSSARAIWYSTYQQYPPVQQILSLRAAALAGDLKLDLADVGHAYMRYAMRRGEPGALLARDQLSSAGSLIAAATILRAILQQPLRSTPIESLCRHPWGEDNLHPVANALASAQARPAKVCEMPPIAAQAEIFAAANGL